MELLRDTMLVFKRQARQSLRNPAWVVVGLIQPVLYLAFFGPLQTRVAGSFGFPAGSGWQVFTAGVLVQLGLFGAGFVGFGIIGEWRMGVIERMRVTPVSRLALLLGRVMRDAAMLVIQSVVLVAASYAFGLRVPFVGVVVALGFVALLAVSLSSLSYAGGLLTKSEDAFAPISHTIMMPLYLLSGILLPMTRAPRWLDVVSRLTPFRYIVDAIRDVFLGQYMTRRVGLGIAAAVLLAVASVALGTRTFYRENA